MSSVIKWLTLILGVLALATGFVDWSLSPVYWQHRLALGIHAQSGLDMRADGPVSLRILPWPRLTFARVQTLNDRVGLHLSDATLSGDIPLWTFLTGQFTLQKIMLDGAKIDFDLNAWHAAHEKPLHPIMDGWFGLLNLRHSQVLLTKNGGPTKIRLSEADINFDRPNRTAPLLLSGDALWHKKPIHWRIWAANLAKLLAHKSTYIEAEIAHPDVHFLLQGNVNVDQALLGPKSYFGGYVRFSVPALPDIQFFGDARPLVLKWHDKLSFAANIRATPAEIVATEAVLDVADTIFSGVLAFRPKAAGGEIAGTLAAKTLRLDAHRLAKIIQVNFLGGPPQPAPSTLKIGPQLDLRLSIQHAAIDAYKFENAALALTTQGDHVSFELAHAETANGEVDGRIAAFIHQNTILSHWNAHLQHVDTQTICAMWLCKLPLTGALDADIAVRGSGKNFETTLASLNGKAELALKNGEIKGIDIDRSLRKQRRTDPLLPYPISLGNTPFQTLDLISKIQAGDASITHGQMLNTALNIQFGGRIGLLKKSIQIEALANQITQDTSIIEPMKMKIFGPWRHPDIEIER